MNTAANNTHRINGKPWAWEATNEQLEAWGFPVEVTDKSMGQVWVVKPGMPRSQAVHMAWAAGHVNVGGHQHQPRKVREPMVVDPEAMAFAVWSKAQRAAVAV